MVSRADKFAIELLVAKLRKDPRKLETVEQLAAAVNMGVTRFKRVFREVTGYSPINFIKSILLQEAKSQLSETTLPVKTISRRAGYKSVSAFVRAFKVLTGITPHQFRSKCLLLTVLNATFLHIFSF